VTAGKPENEKNGRSERWQNGVQMAVKKEIMHRVIDELPEEADLDDAIERLLYIKGIERGLADVEAGRTITQEVLFKRIVSWRK
jgi:predicted transcriptional regulator